MSSLINPKFKTLAVEYVLLVAAKNNNFIFFNEVLPADAAAEIRLHDK